MSAYDRGGLTRTLLDDIGDRWSVLVVGLLAGRPHQYTELRRALEGVSPKRLTQTLRTLEHDGLVRRVVLRVNGRRTSYALTPLGCDLANLSQRLIQWAETNTDAVLHARRSQELSDLR